MKDVYLIIPSLEPKKDFIDIIKELKKTFKNIIVVNDGSSKKYDHIFEVIEKSGVILLKHDINYGKGRALKTAFNYLLDNKISFEAVVTADSDGQHLPKDIENVAKITLENPHKLVLGSRDFDNPNMPKKNRFGNNLTSKMFRIFVGLKIKDTQTGLRGLSKEIVKVFLDTNGERFEYETNMLIDCKEKNVPIKEVTITSVYSKDDYSTHFNPLTDSLRVYKMFTKYILASVSSFAIDILLFTLFKSLLKVDSDVILATIMARVISSAYNFVVNSKMVFKNKNKNSIIKYYFLVVVQMLMSAFIVDMLDKKIKVGATLIKIVVDLIIFVVNFVIQRDWVFKEKVAK